MGNPGFKTCKPARALIFKMIVMDKIVIVRNRVKNISESERFFTFYKEKDPTCYCLAQSKTNIYRTFLNNRFKFITIQKLVLCFHPFF